MNDHLTRYQVRTTATPPPFPALTLPLQVDAVIGNLLHEREKRVLVATRDTEAPIERDTHAGAELEDALVAHVCALHSKYREAPGTAQ